MYTSKYSKNDKIEALRDKLNASNIIKKDLFERSRIERTEPRFGQDNSRMQTTLFGQMGGGGKYDDLKSKIQKEA